ncbi:DODA-type extradiol aromatic ring-opening family dioxygenase [Marinobacterium arenosum]|uniref:DODA-type extradiol aromatic ring-opening family dioxygenase n=1 Tax=Marinobacterium arenosum TaxID=2862496 RepID=UPI001C96C983|nr:class III extradiol ring-cleavage dioxygenase [Marinobacterium arenosum]MBY4676200.1 dioxygenase [Marinobacterium arenosum]
MLPTYFISHGSPELPLQQDEYPEYLRGAGLIPPDTRAILMVSAHWLTEQPQLSAAEQPETVHDFYGFPEPLYRLRYPAPGAPVLAQHIVERLRSAGYPATTDFRRGLDHGAWTPLLLMRPEADLPVFQLSLGIGRGPQWHLELGRLLKPLREQGLLVIGSGGTTHNLRDFIYSPPGSGPQPYAVEFVDWIEQRLQDGELDALLNYRRQAPGAVRAHPTDEHLLPLYPALGAAEGEPVSLLHSSWQGSLHMAVYRFGDR